MIGIVGSRSNETNPQLVEEWCGLGLECELVDVSEARLLGPGFDAALGRLDVLPSLDGVEPGLLGLLWAERRGVAVHNSARALLATHDKLRTARALAQAGIPHPFTTHLTRRAVSAIPSLPAVLKPRFGSWGGDVRLCETSAMVRACLEEFASRSWFRRHGVLVQQAIPAAGRDLRLLVGGGRVVGAIERIAAEGEWRTNVSVGGHARPTNPSAKACELAVAAAAAVEADLVGVDLLPLPDGGYSVIELNGAVDFDDDYSFHGADVYVEAAQALGLLPQRGSRPRAVVR